MEGARACLAIVLSLLVVLTGLAAVPPALAVSVSTSATVPVPNYLTSGYPPPVGGAAMAYDPTSGFTVMFGGIVEATSTPANRTWVFLDHQWFRDTTSHAPPPDRSPVMTYDPEIHGVILFGMDLQTWTFVNGTWSNLTGSVTGPGTDGFLFDPSSITYDAADGVVLVLGYGHPQGQQNWSDELWGFSASAWRQLPSPPSFLYTMFGWDPRTNTTVFTNCSDTATYAADVWTVIPPGATQIPCSDQHSLSAWNPTSDALLVETIVTLWAYAGNWTVLVGVGPGSDGAALDYDPSVGGLLMFGGYNSSNLPASLSETWSYSNGSWHLLLSAPSPASGAGWPPYEVGSLAAVLVGAVLVGVYLFRRRTARPPPPQSAPERL
jgi:hypothetical protein